DPRVLVDRLRAHLIDRGCRIRQAEVRAVEPAPAVRLADGERIAADAIVLAAGAWSAPLAAGCGDRILLESERGYNATFAAPGIAVTRELIFAEHSFVASPLTAGLRIGGTVEFAGLAAPAHPARARALVTLARRYLPGLAAGDGQVWMGHRPATPDSLPVIGPSPRARGVFYAFGHGHLGLTQAATTGRLIAALVAGRAPHIDIGPFASDRFGSPHGG
ncbi:MAG: FAD-binding oxidoreductase, partial [Proteobacteria bacterium]|nr:FAD-binding oxidoreductase [Pseudomonadota bacterium]